VARNRADGKAAPLPSGIFLFQDPTRRRGGQG